jgi:ATP-dependent DNA ligase
MFAGISNQSVLFDLLYLDGFDLRASPLIERKECL